METILAQFVTWNNVINDYAVNVQNLLAPVLGAMVAEVAISRNVDAVHLDLVTPFNKQRAAPQHHLLVEWMKNHELREADLALAQARLGLMEFLEGQADAAASAGRVGAGGPTGRISGSNTLVVDVPRLARQDTSGAATLALLVEALAPGAAAAGGPGVAGAASTHSTADGSSAGGVERTSVGRRAAGATAEAATTSTTTRQSEGGATAGQPGSDGLPSGPGRPPGTAESDSTDASDGPDVGMPQLQTLTQHLQHFNGCVASLQQHLGPNFGIYFHITPAVCAVKGRCAYVRLMRHRSPAQLAAALSNGVPGAGDSREKQQRQMQKARTLGRLSMRAGPDGLAAAAAAAAVAVASPPPPLPSRAPSRAPSRVGSQASLSRVSAGGTLRPAAAAEAPPPAPPAPGSALALFGEDAAPVTLVDLVYSGITDAILRAERSVAVVGNELARLFEKYEPPLSLVEEPKHCRKLKTLPVAREYVEANRKIQQLNAVLFKLAKAVAKTAWLYSTPLSMPDGTLGDVAQMVCEALRRVADTAWAVCRRHLDSVHLVTLLTHYEPFTITPRFTNDESTFRFELEVVVDQALLMTKGFPDFLPPQVRAVWDSLLALAAVVQESRVSLTPLRPQYRKLHAEVREFYTLAPEAAKARKLGIVEAANVVRVVNGNLAAIYEAEEVFSTFNRNVQRLVDAYSRAQREIKADLQLKLAELTTKLPRSIVKPSFSAEMLALMRNSVNPTELAATMTLALTASNMDPSAKAVVQQSLAMGALGTPSQQQQQPGLQGAGLGQGLGAGQVQGKSLAAAAAAGTLPVAPSTATTGAVAALSGVGILQQQQQQQLLAQQQLAAQQQQLAVQMQQAATGTYGMYGMQPAAAAAAGPASAAAGSMAAVPGAPAAAPPVVTSAAAPLMGAASRRASMAPPPAADAPELAAHGTAADYAAQLAMAQAYGYAYNNPYAAYTLYGSGTLGSITVGSKSSQNLAAALAGAAMGPGVAGGAATAPGGTAAAAAGAVGGGTTGVAPAGVAGVANTAQSAPGGMVGAYQSAGYDANTIAMLAQMGYGGFAVASTQQQPRGQPQRQ